MEVKPHSILSTFPSLDSQRTPARARATTHHKMLTHPHSAKLSCGALWLAALATRYTASRRHMHHVNNTRRESGTLESRNGNGRKHRARRIA
jgi:MarR-like DNA-binding transcriptional regulator SgrR of sgrS sRNA